MAKAHSANVGSTGTAGAAGAPSSEYPDPALVRIGLTVALERLYVRQGAFPWFRNTSATEFGTGAAGIHYITRQQAKALLADAEVRVELARWQEKNTYNSLIKHLKEALKDAAIRPTLLKAPAPFGQRETSYSVEVLGTKQQLQDAGIGVGDAFPGELGGPERRLCTLDVRRGQVVNVYRAWGEWPGVYRVVIAKEQDTKAKDEGVSTAVPPQTPPPVPADRPEIVLTVRMPASPAVFKVGDAVITSGGKEARVTGEFDIRKCDSKDGPYVETDGTRYDYRPGYVAQDDDGGTYFWPPHALWEPECSKPRYLRLVTVDGRRVG